MDQHDGWLKDPDICSWYGITCYDSGDNKGKVQKIELASNNLSSGSIWDLSFMKWFEVRQNNATIESFDGIENAASLETLYLSEALMTSIDGIEMAQSLTRLHLTSTSLARPIPSSLFELTSLENVYLTVSMAHCRRTLASCRIWLSFSCSTTN